MKIVCTVQIVNRLAAARGQNGKVKCQKSVVQLRNLPDGNRNILISTTKDVHGQRYDVKKIERIRKSFLSQGLMTIEIKDPPMNIMIRDAPVDQLTELVNKLEGKNDRPTQNTSAATKTSSTDEKVCPQRQNRTQSISSYLLKKPAEQPIERENPPTKRMRTSVDISKPEASSIRKYLKTNLSPSNQLCLSGGGNLTKRPNAAAIASSIFVSNGKLVFSKTLDMKNLELANLTLLDLRERKLICVDKLKLLPPTLKSLNLSKNRLTTLEPELLTSPAMSSVTNLVLSHNKFKKLPYALYDLKNLMVLDVSANELSVIPYNINKLKRLQTLKLDGNKLTFLPETTCMMGLHSIDCSDNPLSYMAESNPLGRVVKGCFNISESPSLLTLAAEAVATHNWRCKYENRIPCGPADVPSLPKSYIDNALFCFCCQKMKLRYFIYEGNSRLSNTAANGIGPLYFSTRKIICKPCLDAQNVRPNY